MFFTGSLQNALDQKNLNNTQEDKLKKSLFLSTIFFFISVLNSQTPTAVTEFEGKGISQSEASSLTDRLRSELFNFGIFQIIERGLMEEILSEQGFQQTGCVSDECVVR